MTILETLDEIRRIGPARRTVGLADAALERMADSHPALVEAVEAAAGAHRVLRQEFPDLVELEEADQIAAIQGGFVNFYAGGAVNPYVALVARGPWIVTSKGGVIHDSGGYGMLGLGHAPANVLAAMARPRVMANVMTANFSQLRLDRALRREIGHRRPGGCPFSRFVCLNSGSEAITLAARLADINAKLQTDDGAPHDGKPIKVIALRQGFHGRTDRPAQFSDSCRKAYRTHLASFRDLENLITVAPNDTDGLREAFERADAEGAYVEAMFLEPVMGEGNPGLAATREFYDTARALTRQRDSLFVVDSIQAGLRTHGCLSIVDYPGFEDAESPDVEAYSKALNAGQFPLSVLALDQRAAKLHRTGVYGNTMTTNPRAMEVACAVLDAITPELRANIRERGEELVERLQALAAELDGPIVNVQGTGLLLSCELADGYQVHGTGSIEESMRLSGIGVIHGGEKSLRFTPHFAITSEEIGLIVEAAGAALRRWQATQGSVSA